MSTKTFYLGIDASKGYADLLILDEDRHCVEPNFQLDDTFDGHHQLTQLLGDFFKTHPKATLYAGIESTGGYEENWYRLLSRLQTTHRIRPIRLNPLGVHAHHKASLKRVKTDPISAVDVAEYMIAHPDQLGCDQEDPLADLRKQWAFIRLLTKQRTQLYNQLESRLYVAAPELLAYCKHGFPQWVLKMLKRYPTAARLSRARTKTLCQIPYVTGERARTLIADAKQSAASADSPAIEATIKGLVAQIMNLTKTIDRQNAMITETCDVPEIELLKTFDCMGQQIAIGLFLEIGAVERFDSAKALASYFGLHPVFEKSGDSHKKYRMSNQGRKEARRLLFMLALNASQNNPYIKEIYEAQLEKGMAKMAALGVCMHKSARILYGMLRHKTPFDPAVDRANREKMRQAENSQPKPDSSRRFQDHDPKAPVSRRQHQKRTHKKKQRIKTKSSQPIEQVASQLSNKASSMGKKEPAADPTFDCQREETLHNISQIIGGFAKTENRQKQQFLT